MDVQGVLSRGANVARTASSLRIAIHRVFDYDTALREGLAQMGANDAANARALARGQDLERDKVFTCARARPPPPPYHHTYSERVSTCERESTVDSYTIPSPALPPPPSMLVPP
jgi:hypothetical protein